MTENKTRNRTRGQMSRQPSFI